MTIAQTGVGEGRLASLLVDGGALTADAIDRAIRLAEASRERLDVVLVRLSLIGERDLARALAQGLDLPQASLDDYPAEPVAEASLSRRFLREHRLVPLAEDGEALTLAMADPLDEFAARAVTLATGKRVLRRVGVASEIEAALDRLFGSGGPAVVVTDDEAADEDVQRLKDLASEAPVVRLVNQIITRAVELRASDIHVEPFDGRLRVRFRVDGILIEQDSPAWKLRAALVSRLKIMARLNIAERRLPQDGRIRIGVRGRDIDLRVSTLPTLHGESVVLRILDRERVVLEFDALGFDPQFLARFRPVLEAPHGILLVTGPTGSGKTTTLYTSLKELNAPGRKIITVEDPIEYQLDGVNQVQVKPQIGLTFAGVLRAVLRQDPDVLLVGEIRDGETAQIAAQAALTGHSVLATVHTNSAAGTITRLLDMGLEDYLLTATINGVVAQRLVRILCPQCKAHYLPDVGLAAQLGLAADAPLCRPVGCPACNGSGYRGRQAVVEFLPMSEEVRRLVLRRADTALIHRQAVTDGMRTMFEDGLTKAAAGLTSLDEVLRVTRESE